MSRLAKANLRYPGDCRNRISILEEPRAATRTAFARTELLVILGVLTLLAAVVLPALANTRPRSHRVICANNLRQIGIALQVWGGEHEDWLLWNASMESGGTRLHPLSANAWLHFAYLSNELSSANLLFCPSDIGTPASDFTGDPVRGYLHPNFRNRATSYFLDAHPNGLALATPFLYGGNILMGDRNIQTFGSRGCSVLATASYIPIRPIRPDYGWTTGLHGLNAGNLLLFDGRVEFCDDAQLRVAMDSGVFTIGSGDSRADVCLPR